MHSPNEAGVLVQRTLVGEAPHKAVRCNALVRLGLHHASQENSDAAG